VPRSLVLAAWYCAGSLGDECLYDLCIVNSVVKTVCFCTSFAADFSRFIAAKYFRYGTVCKLLTGVLILNGIRV